MQAAADDVAGKHGKDGSGRDGGVLAGEGGGELGTPRRACARCHGCAHVRLGATMDSDIAEKRNAIAVCWGGW